MDYLEYILTTRKTEMQAILFFIATGQVDVFKRLLLARKATMTSYPRVKCRDGASVSVQVGEHMYSTPRDNNPNGRYTHVECGFPSHEPPESWKQYSETPEYPLSEKLQDVWYWVFKFPREEINRIGKNRKEIEYDRYIGAYTKTYDSASILYSLKIAYRSLKDMLPKLLKKHTIKDTVFAYVPVDVLMEYIELHGGVDNEASWKNYDEYVTNAQSLW